MLTGRTDGGETGEETRGEGGDEYFRLCLLTGYLISSYQESQGLMCGEKKEHLK